MDENAKQSPAKLATLIAIGNFLAFTIFLFFGFLAQGAGGAMLVVLGAGALQGYLFWRVYTCWDSMTTTGKWLSAIGGTIGPYAAFFALVFLAGFVVIAVLFWILKESGTLSPVFPPSTRGATGGHSGGIGVFRAASGIFRDQFGNRTVFVDRAGVITDQYGNRAGFIDGAGVITDQYGDRSGSIDRAGVIRDQYGDRTGSIDRAGVIRDQYGNRTGSIGDS